MSDELKLEKSVTNIYITLPINLVMPYLGTEAISSLNIKVSKHNPLSSSYYSIAKIIRNVSDKTLYERK